MEGMGAQRWSKVSGLGKDVVAQMVKNLPAMPETQVQSLGRKDSLEKGVAAPSSILAWEIPCAWGQKELD